jgi:hypothetical protein
MFRDDSPHFAGDLLLLMGSGLGVPGQGPWPFRYIGGLSTAASGLGHPCKRPFTDVWLESKRSDSALSDWGAGPLPCPTFTDSQ